jgi:cytochrome c-type biogenesis protein CcmF
MISTYKYAFLGQFLYVSALIVYVVSIFLKTKRQTFLKVGSGLLWSCYILLTFCFLIGDFHLKVVADHSGLNTPWIYKLVGIWGSSEGSFLLWICFLSCAGWILKTKTAQCLFTLHMVGFLALQSFILPVFETVVSAVNESDLNPLLQDHSMVLHPPILYLGQTLWGMIFFKLLDRPFDKTKITALTKSGFLILTLGIALGSYWAYYELGWGGFWYWDPVEVVSLFAWLFYILCFHLLQKQKLNGFYLLSMFAWPVTLLGSALIRSGVLNSVHSFAENSDFMELFGVLFIVTLLPSLYVLFKTNPFKEDGQKISFLEMSCLLLWGGIFSVLLLSVLIPIFFKNISFAPAFFEASVWPLSLPFLLLLGLMPYKKCFDYKLFLALNSLSALGVFASLLSKTSLPFMANLTISLSCFAFICTVFGFIKIKRNISLLLGHLGWVLLIFSTTLTIFLKEEERVTFQNSEHNNCLHLKNGDVLEILETHAFEGENFIGHEVTLKYTTLLKNSFIFKPVLKYYPHSKITHADMDLRRNGLHQYGVVIESMTEDHLQLYIFQKKYIYCLWFSILLMMLGILGSIASPYFPSSKKTAML